MKLIIGLGNPGVKYMLTRHNIGFMVLDGLCKHLNLSLTQERFQGRFVKTEINDVGLILVAPQTYMNCSGQCVFAFIKFFKIKIEDILIVHDEADFAFGQIQFKNEGSDGGHNGLKNIFLLLKTTKVMRLRIGVGKNIEVNRADWVLSNFNYQELMKLQNPDLLIKAILDWVKGIPSAQLFNLYNNKVI